MTVNMGFFGYICIGAFAVILGVIAHRIISILIPVVRKGGR